MVGWGHGGDSTRSALDASRPGGGGGSPVFGTAWMHPIAVAAAVVCGWPCPYRHGRPSSSGVWVSGAGDRTGRGFSGPFAAGHGGVATGRGDRRPGCRETSREAAQMRNIGSIEPTSIVAARQSTSTMTTASVPIGTGRVRRRVNRPSLSEPKIRRPWGLGPGQSRRWPWPTDSARTWSASSPLRSRRSSNPSSTMRTAGR